MKKTMALIRVSFLEGLALRGRIPIIIAEQCLAIAVNYYIWKQVSLSQLNASYGILQICTYPIIVWTLQLFLNSNVLVKMMQQYRSGSIAIDITRPVNYFQMLFCSSFGKSIFKLIFACVPTFILFFVTMKIYVPQNQITFLLFGTSILFSAVLMAQIDYCLGRMIFLTENGNGLFMFRCLLIDIFSGILFPIEYTPLFMKHLIYFSPIRHIYYTPTMIFLEISSVQYRLANFFQQIAWVIIGWFILKLIDKQTKGFLHVQGG